ncbi:MAG: hypothetical protein A2051_06120 [Desulfovibrionales bacterium GWA2_65_9]|nr:MAG: hypothetical protein A2051_06120 [Desulfovibrionales bacterium GWA2_65_9]
MQNRPTATPRGPRTPLSARPALTIAQAIIGPGFSLALLLAFLAPAELLAGQIRESDLSISSQVGKVVTSAEGEKTDARSTVHSIDIKRGSQTGEVHVTGQAGRVTTQAGGQNTSADSAVGGVNVGAKQ